MKNLVLLLTLGLFIVVSQSCKKPPLPVIQDTDVTTDTTGNGGNGGETQVSPYVGTWSYTKIELKNGILSFMGSESGTFTGTGINIVGEVVISENPNVFSTELEFTADVDAEIFGQTQNQKLPVDKTTSTGTWVESHGEITLTEDGGKKLGVISSTSTEDSIYRKF